MLVKFAPGQKRVLVSPTAHSTGAIDKHYTYKVCITSIFDERTHNFKGISKTNQHNKVH